MPRWTMAACAAVLAILSMMLIPAPASAHIPTATGSGDNYSSVFGHGPTVYVQLMNSLRGYTNMVTDYNNARGHLNDLTDSGMQATPPYTDVLPGAGSADVYIVLAGSSEESVIDGAIGFMPCSSATAWGTVRAANAYGSGSESHTLDQKICL